MSLSLYEATDGLLTVKQWIEEHADEILLNDGELPQALAELIDQAEGDFATKVERVALYIREVIATKAANKAEADRFTQRVKVLENTEKGLKRYLVLCLEAAEKTKVETTLVRVRTQKNGTPSLVACPDVSALPPEYVTTPPPPPPQVNSNALLAAFRQGVTLPEGVKFETGKHLRIE